MANTPESGLPEKVSLGEVLSRIMLTPGEVAHMLQTWGQHFSGSSQADLTGKLNSAAADVTTPRSVEEDRPQRDYAPPSGYSVAPPVEQPMESTQAPDRMTPPEAGQNAPAQDVNRPLEPPLAPPDQNR